MSGAHDDRRRPRASAIGFAFGLAMLALLALLTGLLLWAAVSAIDWTAVLRFIAPTAFETRPIEVILGGKSA